MTEETKPKFGTFLGVFTPTVLTILGVIMYQRSGWLVGSSGLVGAWGVVLLANTITFVTALSMSALATNMRVGVGGAYYLISRSLGLEVGGAIGIPLYLSQALSVTLYAYGLAGALALIYDPGPTGVMVLAGLIIAGVGAVAAKSTELTLKLQLPIMAAIALSLVVFFAGVSWGNPVQVAMVAPEGGLPFFAVFAVFFPAVTGILAGVSLSGDLEDPGRSIPVGVLSAVAVGFVVYMTIPYALSVSASAEAMRSNDEIWGVIAWRPASWFPAMGLILPGMVGAILSSAFGSVLAAPRTVQALAMDRLAPQALGEIDEETGEPLNALWITVAIALVSVLLGDLDTVAFVLTMFFLTTYGTLNLVAGLEDLVGDPSFRPRIRVPWWVSFIGAVACVFAMFAIWPAAALLAIGIEAVIYWQLRRRSLEAAWGDVRSGFWLTAARYALLSLRDSNMDPRNWRPQILLFTADLSRTLPLARLASDFGQSRGIVTISTLLIGDVEEHRSAEDLVARNNKLLEVKGILAFPEVAAVPSYEAGVVTVAQSNGYAGLASNTVMFGWPGDEPERLAVLLGLCRKLSQLEKCTLISRVVPEDPSSAANKTIVVWWKGREHNGDLMLLLAHLLTMSESWRAHRIVLKSLVDDPETQRARQREFTAMLEEIRMKVEVDVVLRQEGEDVRTVIRQQSRAAALVFLGLSRVEKESEVAEAQCILDMVEGLPSTILVRNAGPFRGRLV